MGALSAAAGGGLLLTCRGGRTSARGLVGRLASGALALAACARPGSAPAVHARDSGAGTPAESGGPDARAATPASSPLTRGPEIRYELTHDPTAACWRVRLRATGIDLAGGAVRLVLEDWG